jgi:hypothetical protein
MVWSMQAINLAYSMGLVISEASKCGVNCGRCGVAHSEEIKVIKKSRPRKSGVKLICRTRGCRGGQRQKKEGTERGSHYRARKLA